MHISSDTCQFSHHSVVYLTSHPHTGTAEDEDILPTTGQN